MNTLYQVPRLHEHEGFYYVELNGEFFKGCRRCGGTGHYSFNGYDSICYLCNNDPDRKLGDHFSTEADAQKWCHELAVRAAQRERKAERERLAKLEKRQAAWDTLAAEHPAVWELLSKVADTAAFAEQRPPVVTERNSFVSKMADQLWFLDEWAYTERMIAALERVAEARATRQEEAASHPAPTGRVVVTGEIVSAKLIEGDYGTTYKMLVKSDEGFKVWSTVPSAQVTEFFQTVDYTDIIESLKGRRITFTATLEPSHDDVSFAFASRPSKGAWL